MRKARADTLDVRLVFDKDRDRPTVNARIGYHNAIVMGRQPHQLSDPIQTRACTDLTRRKKRTGGIETSNDTLPNILILLIRIDIHHAPTVKPAGINCIKLRFGHLQHLSDPFTFGNSGRAAMDSPTPCPVKGIGGVNLTGMEFSKHRRQMTTQRIASDIEDSPRWKFGGIGLERTVILLHAHQLRQRKPRLGDFSISAR